MTTKPVSISIWKWSAIIRELRGRGMGRRESGAFLLGREENLALRVKQTVYYDDLDPSAFDRGYVRIDGTVYGKLWKVCKAEHLSVVADIHAHPGDSTRQSDSDRHNPMIPKVGHVAIIVPRFAQFFSFRHGIAAVYRYLGEYQWETCDREAREGLRVTTF